MTTKRKPRTLAAPKQIKDDEIRMRVSADQKQALMKAAARAGLETSAWLRQLGLRAAGFLPEAK